MAERLDLMMCLVLDFIEENFQGGDESVREPPSYNTPFIHPLYTCIIIFSPMYTRLYLYIHHIYT